jgi:hypothetical protein
VTTSAAPARDNVLNARRVRLWSASALAGVTLGFIILISTSSGLRTALGGRVGGDFPAFYAAARIVRAGTAGQLYDPATQREAQRGLLGDKVEGWIHFAYPPYVAWLYAPLSLVSFKTAYVVYTILAALAAVAAILLLRQSAPLIHAHLLTAIAAALTFYPLLRANLGGQNTAFSLLCAAGAVAALSRTRYALAGICLGLWMFKPQLALPVAVFTAVAYPRILRGLLPVMAGWYALGVATAGASWPAWWIRDGVLPFAAADLIVDKGNGISLREVAVDLGVPIAGIVAAVVVAALTLRVSLIKGVAPLQMIGVASATALLIAPHALYYDGGLIIVGLAAAVTLGRVPALILVAWLAGLAQVAALFVPVPPMTLLLLATVAMLTSAHETVAARFRRPSPVPQYEVPPYNG